ncbi:MAG: hypothetical protein WB780_06370 [Candidatus Acidiferrales bacterium]
MLSPSINYWMSFVGLIYLVAGIFAYRKEIIAARGWDRLITWGTIFMAVPLAMFGTDHLASPAPIKDIVPSWIPAHLFWTYLVGCALLAAATSLTLRKFVRLSSTLLGLMFFLFVCLMHIPNALADPKDRFAWQFVFRDITYAAAAWALAGLYSRASSPQQSKWLILFGRIVIAIAAIFFAVEHFLHPEFAPGVSSSETTPSWVPLPSLWGYIAGAILLAAGIALALNKKPRMAATTIGSLMTVLSLSLYLLILILALAHNGSTQEINDALDVVFDTLLYGGSALVLASALSRDSAPALSHSAGVV